MTAKKHEHEETAPAHHKPEKKKAEVPHDPDLRDLFAVHAPHTPAAWFKPTMPEKPDDPAAQAEWEADHLLQSSVQWPWAWADAMLEQRGK